MLITHTRDWGGQISVAMLLVAMIGLIAAYIAITQPRAAEQGDMSRATQAMRYMDAEERAHMSSSRASNDPSRQTVSSDDPRVQHARYAFAGTFVPVEGGEATGTAQMGFENDLFLVSLALEGLPAAPTDSAPTSYEAWLVRREPFHFIDLGPVAFEGNMSTGSLVYASLQDWSDHAYVVITQEQEDGDAQPALQALAAILLEK